MEPLNINQVIQKISDGNLRIPAFQRGFVWDSESVAFLMDSIYKGYPFGTIQVWRTREQLVTERKIGPFELFDRDAEYPIDYIIDGQQRITSIFGVFQNSITLPQCVENPFLIYFDLQADTNFQDSQFVYLKEEEVDKARHFPLNVLFDSALYRRATRSLSPVDAAIIDDLHTRFLQARIPVQLLETDDKEKVAIVFERINRKGVPLDTLQLLTAWTWSEDFELRSKFELLADELRGFGFGAVGENENLLLRVSSAILTGNGSTKSLMDLNGSTVRERFDEIENGIKGAIDFLKSELKVEKLENLPSPTILVPLSAFFSCPSKINFHLTDTQRKELLKWIWRVFFSKRYSAGVTRNINRDISEIMSLKDGRENQLSSVSINITPNYFLNDEFRMGSVNAKTFILMLANNNPRSFLSGTRINLSDVLKEYNRNEFHHIYPKAFLHGRPDKSYPENILANFSIISRADNNIIRDKKPSVYRTWMPREIGEIAEAAFFTEKSLVKDDYNSFVKLRAEHLARFANRLMGIE